MTSGGIKAERQVRAAVQTHRHVSYVFAGSKTRLLRDMTRQHSRPFYRMGSSLFLGPVPREAFIPFLRERFEDAGSKVLDKALERILDLAEDVRYNLQHLAHRCRDLLAGMSAHPQTLTPEFAERLPGAIAEPLQRFLTQNRRFSGEASGTGPTKHGR